MTAKTPQPHRPLPIRLINGIGRVFQRLGLSFPSLDSGALLNAAIKKTGLNDFGDPSFREGMEAFVNSAQHEGNLNLLGRIAARDLVVNLLTHRLQLQGYWHKHPALEQEEIRRPFIIVGLPRTGTTALYNLLSQDSAHRMPMGWEVTEPFPLPEEATFETDPRIAKVQKQHDNFNKMLPSLYSMHPRAARLPEECQEITAHAFASVGLSTMLTVPSYQEWLVLQDFRNALAFHKRFLKYLQSGIARERWLLKSPGHVQYLPTLLETYPDAAIVQTHRDPLTVMASVSSITFTVRGFFCDNVDRLSVGQNQLSFWSRLMQKLVEARTHLSDRSDQFFDVQFQDIVHNPLETVQQIYAYFGFELKDETKKRMEHHLEEHRLEKFRKKHGAHMYTPELFGLDPTRDWKLFSEYCERFKVQRNEDLGI